MKNKLQKEIESYVSYWQLQLRLVDWDIECKVSTDIKECPGYGMVRPFPNDQRAEIYILDPDHIPEDWKSIQDLEVTTVHELLHIRFLYCIKKSDCHAEMSIETTARALVANKRGISPEELS